MAPRHLAITMGDPAGIGPEIIVKAAARLRPRIEAGDARACWSSAATRRWSAARAAVRARRSRSPRSTETDAHWPALWRACRRVRRASRSARASSPPMADASPSRRSSAACGWRMAGRVGGIVTAPLNKEALNQAGYHYPGHTEMLAELTGVRGSCMMLAHGNMRVSHVTTHIALEDVPKRATAGAAAPGHRADA